MTKLVSIVWMLQCAQGVYAATEQPRANLSPVTGGDVLQWLLGLAAVLLVILGCAWLARKFGSFSYRGNGVLKVVEGLSLGTRERVVLLQAGNKRLLVGITPGQMRTLLVLDDDSSEPGSPSGDDPEPPKTFANNLRDVLQGGAK